MKEIQFKRPELEDRELIRKTSRTLVTSVMS